MRLECGRHSSNSSMAAFKAEFEEIAKCILYAKKG